MSGDAQSTKVLVPPADPLRVKVVDQNGVALAGATVNWEVTAGSVTLNGGSSTITDASGEALGLGSGPRSVTANVDNVATVTFTENAS